MVPFSLIVPWTCSCYRTCPFGVRCPLPSAAFSNSPMFAENRQPSVIDTMKSIILLHATSSLLMSTQCSFITFFSAPRLHHPRTPPPPPHWQRGCVQTRLHHHL